LVRWSVWLKRGDDIAAGCEPLAQLAVDVSEGVVSLLRAFPDKRQRVRGGGGRITRMML
jgi:hypothetical protein